MTLWYFGALVLNLCLLSGGVLADEASLLRHERGTNARRSSARTLTVGSHGALDSAGTTSNLIPLGAPVHRYYPTKLVNPVSVSIQAGDKYALVADQDNCVIRMVYISDGRVLTIAGSGQPDNIDGDGALASFKKPSNLAVAPDGSYVLVTDETANQVRKVDISEGDIHEVGHGGIVETLVGSGTDGDRDGIGTSDTENTTSAIFSHPGGVAFDPYAIFALISDTANNKIRKVHLETFVVTTVASHWDENGKNATFNGPRGLGIHPHGEFALVADTGNGLIRRVDLNTGAVSTMMEDLKEPRGIAMEWEGTYCLIVCAGSHTIHKVDMTKPGSFVISTFAGTGKAGSKDAKGLQASFNRPTDISIDQNRIYALVADSGNNKIRKVMLDTGEVTTLAGPDITLVHDTDDH